MKVRDGNTERLPVSPELRAQLVERAKEFRRAPTRTENRLWQVLRGQQLGVKFRRQQPIGRFIVDFFCVEALLIVEVDGAVHVSQREHDAARDELLQACGYRLLHIPAEDIDADLLTVLDLIRAHLV